MKRHTGTIATAFPLLKHAALALLVTLVGLIFLVGCNTVDRRPTDPYYIITNWYVRENARPQYSATFDVFYLHPALYDSEEISQKNLDYTMNNTSYVFGKEARIFAPLCHDLEDCKRAFQWYYNNYHSPKRPIVFIGEGEGAKLLEALLSKSKPDGMVLAKLSPEKVEGNYVTPEMVAEIDEEVRKYLYAMKWNTPYEAK